MSGEKYIGLDVHQATISLAVVDSQGIVVMESILETKASTLLEFFSGLRASLFVTFEYRKLSASAGYFLERRDLLFSLIFKNMERLPS